jgi:hypothetical protein
MTFQKEFYISYQKLLQPQTFFVIDDGQQHTFWKV